MCNLYIALEHSFIERYYIYIALNVITLISHGPIKYNCSGAAFLYILLNCIFKNKIQSCDFYVSSVDQHSRSTA